MWNYRHYPAGIGARLCLMYASGKLYSRFPLFKGAWHKATLAYRASMFRTFCRYQGDILARHEREWSDGETVENAPVFVFWWQGLDGAPDIVKSCIASMRRHIGSHPLVVITRDNVWDYVDIPAYIYEKVERKIITLTHFSDILRFALLERYGGLWLDATIMVLRDITDDVFAARFFTQKAKLAHEDDTFRFAGAPYWSGYLLGGHKGLSFFSLMKDLFFDYWKHNDIQLDYFLIDDYMAWLARDCRHVASMLAEADICMDDMYFLAGSFPRTFDGAFLNEYRSKDIGFNKLGYKNLKAWPDDSVYSMLVKTDGRCLE